MAKPFADNDTIAAVATPSGAGALGVVRLSGPAALDLAGSGLKFFKYKSIEDVPLRQAALARWTEAGREIDQVTAVLYRAPKSYTGEDAVEISCHGSPHILKRVVAGLVKAGARLAGPGEFSQRAFLNGKMDLSQAEAVADLIRAQTDLSRAVALSQLEGGLSREIRGMRDGLVEILAHLEVDLDHSDDATVGRTLGLSETAAKLEAMLQKARALVRSYDFGRVAREGVRIAIVGKPNAGKSSLLNCLLKTDRAIVTDIPGTTRDTIEEGFDLLGLPAVLVDTAGIRGGTFDRVEEIGIRRTLQSLEQADGVLVVLDAGRPLSGEDGDISRLVSGKKKGVLALNKSDLSSKINPEELEALFPGMPFVSVSALRNEGLEELLSKLSGQVAPSGLETLAASGETLVTSLRHRDCLVKAENSLAQALSLCREDRMEECLALDLRGALDALGEIVGEVVTEDILNEIFSKFCIGK